LIAKIGVFLTLVEVSGRTLQSATLWISRLTARWSQEVWIHHPWQQLTILSMD